MSKAYATGRILGDSPTQEVLTEPEASAFLRLCGKSLRRRRQRNEIPFAQIGGRIVYLRSQLLAWLEAGGTINK
ncbi:MAG TPA: helix-turn-helix domain-containing protein [Tepidisphaeraceae bacterium]|jgi:hypothetical protein